MGWRKGLGVLAALAVAAGGGAAAGVATRPTPGASATVAPPAPDKTPVAAASRARLQAGRSRSNHAVTSPPAASSAGSSAATSPAGSAPTTSSPGDSSPTAAALTVPTLPPTTAPAPGAAPTTTTTPTTLAPPIDSGAEYPTPAFKAANPKVPAVAALVKRLSPVVASSPGCLMVTQGSTALYQSNPVGLVAPGSSQKLLVAAAALDVLGPNYTFTTEVVASSRPVNGTVGDLWIVGGGDPVLEEPAFHNWWAGQLRYTGDPYTNIESLVTAVRAAGVTNVTGAIHGDDARYDALRINPAWPADTETTGNIAPMSALSLDMGFESWGTPAVVPADQASSVAAGFAQLLGGIGVKAPDNPRGADGVPPAGSVVIASIKSPPLWQILGAMLRPSDNQIAELLVKELGYHATGLGTTAAGLAVVRSADVRLGIPWNGTVMVDGSGLSHEDRTTCQTLLAALYLGDRPGFTTIPEDLSVAGVDGTLADRFTTAPLRGHLRAKTGTIDGAAAMVGEIDLGKPVRFAMVFNQPVADYLLVDDEDDAVNAIAPYP